MVLDCFPTRDIIDPWRLITQTIGRWVTPADAFRADGMAQGSHEKMITEASRRG